MKPSVFAALLVVACANKQDAPAGDQGSVPQLSVSEVQRGKDACSAYVMKVCACADHTPSLKSQCELARALPEAVRLDAEVSTSPDSKPNDVLGAQKAMRQTVKECIEETAKLPSLGCQ
jgi:hypothetical protein